MLDEFVRERLRTFGPYEDAIAQDHPFVYHSVLTPAVGNCAPATTLACTDPCRRDSGTAPPVWSRWTP